MKAVKLILILATFAGSTVAGLTLQEILQRQAGALGGIDRLRNLQSYMIKASVTVGGMKGSTVTYYRAPDRFRTDVALPLMNSSQGCNGDDCWITDNQGLTLSLGADMRGITMTEMAIENWSYCDSATFSGDISLVDSNATVDSALCYVIRIAPRNGTPAMLYIDKATFLPRQFKIMTDAGTFYSRFHDYRPVNGVMMPFRTTEMSDAGFVAGISTVTDVKVNVALADSLFAPTAIAGGNWGLPVDVESVVVPFELWRNHIYISAWVNGKGPFRFIFDSGAGGTAINRKLVNDMGLTHLGTAEARGVGGADSSEVYQIDTLEVACVRLMGLPGSTIDFDQLESVAETRIDGIVGYDLLNRFAISVDYTNHRLVIYRPGTEPHSTWGEPCRLTIDLRLPYVDATVEDTIPARFRLDTGSASTIDFHTPFVLAHNLPRDTSAYRPVTSTGIGGTIEGNVGLSPAIDICGNRIDSLLVNFSSTPTGLFAGSNTAGNVGAGVLKAFTVTFDYGRETVYLKKTGNSQNPASLRNMAGVELGRKHGKIMVRRVIAGRAADGFLAPEDIIVEIDGLKTKGKSIDEVDEMLTGKRGSDVRIKVERNGRVSEMDILLDSLY
ncbi:MAG: aspartyl protease family protein [candidate division Zixibacteria bacterium]|nr:aspartyl protease family protein [candidate division Zixibacteria bacterium]